MKIFYTKDSKKEIGLPEKIAKPVMEKLREKEVIVSETKKYGQIEVTSDGFKLIQKLINIEVM